MAEKFEGKVVVVAGGTRGLGFDLATGFARQGARVVVASRTRTSVNRAVEDLKALGARAAGMTCDLADLAKVEALATFALRSFGRIDLWVNAAVASAPLAPTADLPGTSFQAMVDTNVVGSYNGSVVAIRSMGPRGGGKIINLVGSGRPGDLLDRGRAANAAFSWIRRFSASLAVEYRKGGVGVYTLDPGIIQAGDPAGNQGLGRARALLASILAVPSDFAVEKALWLGGSATSGWTRRHARVATPGFVASRIFLWATTGLGPRPQPEAGRGAPAVAQRPPAAGAFPEGPRRARPRSVKIA